MLPKEVIPKLAQSNTLYKGNSKSKVPYFITAESISELSWQAWVQLVHIFTTI
jgi:hypothetical protein